MLPIVSCEFLGIGEPVIPKIGGMEISWLGGNPSDISNDEVMRLCLFWLGIRGMGEVSQVR
ncbi:hypothetical protein Bca4012_049104 [Brassica carinata]|uniref:(rape) hypothetical protein n=1 Tax=Brassica napus TaxID=3708 RepID=A0A816K5V2_BRANA|nr:uncharacterized protein LOC111211525 [Brassica napus]CAF1897489.1 unnamed protein product [Brassica napus]